jgi:general stress protein 26
MGDKKNLQGRESIEQIQELVDDLKTCMFCTHSEGKLRSRPMSAQKADDEGNIWFLSDKTSHKHQELVANAEVDLLFGAGEDKWLALHGTGETVHDKTVIASLWTPIAKIWMPGGVEDPNLCAVKVKYDDGYYWDNKNGRMVAFAKMAAAFVTGKTMDDGIEGKLQK